MLLPDHDHYDDDDDDYGGGCVVLVVISFHSNYRHYTFRLPSVLPRPCWCAEVVLLGPKGRTVCCEFIST